MREEVSMTELVLCLSEIIDLVSPLLANHHKRVAGIAYNLCNELGLSELDKKDITFAGALHDVGGITVDERLDALQFDFEEEDGHPKKGCALLRTYEPFADIASIVRYHHTPWDFGKCGGNDPRDIPYGSHILHLADRIAVAVKPGRDILDQAHGVRRKINSGRNKKFLPELVDVFMDISEKEYFWLDISTASLGNFLKIDTCNRTYTLDDEHLLGLMQLFARIIDFRSRFTATHSGGVAAVAEAMAKGFGFCNKECNMMRIAGYIHDLGKLAVPVEILEKPTGLTNHEYNLIKTHAYFTDRVLRDVKGFEQIRKWGALHHERLDGGGYPFRLGADQLSTGSRIMAVADVFVALAEDRPYRKGMQPKEIRSLMRDMANNGALDTEIVELLEDTFDNINKIRIDAQYAAKMEYQGYTC